MSRPVPTLVAGVRSRHARDFERRAEQRERAAFNDNVRARSPARGELRGARRRRMWRREVVGNTVTGVVGLPVGAS
jgi:hypothetical protein